MKDVIQRALSIVIGGALLGLLGNTISPRRIPLVAAPKPPPSSQDVVTLAEVREVWQLGTAMIFDARNPSEYAAGHIPTASNLPSEQFDVFFPKVAPMLTPETVVVVYCDGVQCDLSHEVQQRLRGLGFKNVRVLNNGWTLWQQAGLPGTTGENP
jgi:rhodanese-related sulfurtransferase